MLLTAIANAAVFYVAPNGNDVNPGTAGNPWQTLAKVNETVQPGDTVLFRDGVYAGILSPAVSGASAKQPITYRSETRRGAVLIGHPDARYIVNLKNQRFIVKNG